MKKWMWLESKHEISEEMLSPNCGFLVQSSRVVLAVLCQGQRRVLPKQAN